MFRFRSLLLVALAVVAFAGCGDSVDDPNASKKDLMMAHEWTTTSYKVAGTDKTNDTFTPKTVTFGANDVMTIETIGGASVSGTWSVDPTDETRVTITAAGLPTSAWDIKTASSTSLSLHNADMGGVDWTAE